MSTGNRVILVTGANRGIGLAIIQSLAIHPHTKNDVLLMGCRDKQKGEAAINQVKKNIGEAASATVNIQTIEIDVVSDTSIRNAAHEIESKHQKLDVLINNAGFAMMTSAADFSDVRQAFTTTYNTNVISVAMTTSLLLPLLRASSAADGQLIKSGTSNTVTDRKGMNDETRNSKVINISSARGSMARSVAGLLPPTASAAYSVSKTALNALTIEMSRQNENQDIEFQLACPGHCKTQFNGFRGLRDPLQGANVVRELVVGRRRPLGCWETVADDLNLIEVPW